MKTKINYLLRAALCLLATLTATHAGGKGPGGGNQSTGSQIAISAPVADRKTGQTSYEIFSINSDGSGAKQLTSHGGHWPMWSSDQKYIAYSRLHPITGEPTIYVLAVKGGAQFPVVQASGTGHDWWPDDSGIVYTGTEAMGYGIWFVSVDPATGAVGTPVLLLEGGGTNPKVSPDGTKIAFGSGKIRVFDLTTQTVTMLAGNSSATPSWSPDGSKLAFMGVVCYGSTDNCYGEIVIANPDGTGWTPVTALHSQSYFPVWSPDGTEIAFSSYVSGARALYKTTIGSGVVTLIYGGAEPGSDWAP